MKNLLLRLKNLIIKNKSFFIFFLFIIILFVSFFKINHLEIKINHEPVENVSPVDYSRDRSKLVCYANNTPKEVQDTCDILSPESKGKKK
ncbi:hypothetical protein [Leptospira mayottensis]|uniref:Uncharacterized protein n=2 Tax=Leptospira mayottensis TaxID=1137606 RepID=A0AA87MJP2_9LEPT|nr:hypothetical protein [Leptospira mayottensis]AXR66617.1 hypothetical protein DQM28_20725 [Leptospira mayottensis]AZQ04258.1 hypothetical protein LEP1GSC190_19660 [Leptospira mayottensis 200901116]EKR98087.1 hypothetical protein LEP1GSC125_1532 [Leptospira mayottensis 200901122]TGN04341.1 hypothetical protein EHR03_10895 [Leptospira mayottensis]